MKRIIRVFPRRTKATPEDELVAVMRPPDLFDEADEVFVSVAFSWDFDYAAQLAEQWKIVAPVKVGGPAIQSQSGEFVPGMFLKKGYVITSRGCPNRCWFCRVWQNEGTTRELPITEGWNVLDDNLLACSEGHVRAVFAMLKTQKTRAQFTGGLEAKRLMPWHCALLADLKPKQIFFAYDTPDDYEPLLAAGKLLQQYGINNRHTLRCYVLCGHPKDELQKAEKRMLDVFEAGFCPMAMLCRDTCGHTKEEWRKFQRLWARPAIIFARLKGK